MGGGWFVGWVDKPRKNMAYSPRVALAKKGKLFSKHPGRELLQPIASFWLPGCLCRELQNDFFRVFVEHRKIQIVFVFRHVQNALKFFWDDVPANSGAKVPGL